MKNIRILKPMGLVLLVSVFFLAVSALPALAAPAKILRLATTQPLDHDLTKGCLYYAKLVEERSQGRLKIEVYPAGQMFSDKDMPKALPSGAVDIAQVTSGIWVGLIPALGIAELPFFYKDKVHYDHMLSNAKVRKILDAEMEKKGVKLMFRQTLGDSFGYVSTKPLHNLEDFKGKRIRANGEMPAEIVKALGATPVFMGTGDVYLALQRGTIDGLNTAPCLAWDKKYYEVIRNYVHMDSWDITQLMMVLMSMKTWNELEPDLQEIMTTAAKEAEVWSLKLSNDRSQECVKSLQAHNVQIYYLPDKERERWARACRPIVQIYIKRSGEVGKQLVQAVEEIR